MRITDPSMERKMHRLMRDGNHCYTLDDVMSQIDAGTMQSHTFDNTWVITQVHEFPQRKAVDLTFVVGHADEFLEGLPSLYDWTKSIGADLITGSGRDGWWSRRLPGWRRMGSLYSKDLRNG
jgi:hypothetical protein